MTAPTSPSSSQTEKNNMGRYFDGITLGSISLFLSFFGASLTFPFLQSQRDKLGCDALCYGNMQSVRSGLSMLGLVLVGRLSDRLGRTKIMWIGVVASLFSYAVNIYGTSLTSIWISLVPSALLNHNFSVMKALFADYSADYGYSESQRASAIGKLGMVAGLSFMLGPVLGTSLVGDYRGATLTAMLLTVLSGVMLSFLPVSINETSSSKLTKEVSAPLSLSSLRENVRKFFDLPALQSPGARLLLFMRCLMALAFNIFMTIWTVSLKTRFDFGAREHAYFMGWIGLWYALSQGYLARVFIQFFREDPTTLIQICAVCLGLGRVAAMMTSSLPLVYGIMAGVIIALGVVNTTIASDTSRLAGKDQVGGLYGVFEAVEGFAGLVGPSLGGLLFKLSPHLPLVTVVAAYGGVFLAIALFYHKHVVEVGEEKEREGKEKEGKEWGQGEGKQEGGESSAPPLVEKKQL